MCRYLPPSAVNGPVSAWGLYKSDDDQTHSDDLCCRWRRVRREPRSRWRRAIRYPPARSIRRRRSLIRPAAIRPTIAARLARRISTRWKMTRRRMRRVRPRCRRPVRCFRPTIRAMAARWARPLYSDRGAPTGPILSPDDPRYGRPADCAPPPPVTLFRLRRVPPAGPILSPDDPRYGRPDGPPPVIYSDRPAGPPQQTYSDRGNGDNRVPRPPRRPSRAPGPSRDRSAASGGHRVSASGRGRRQADGAVRAAAG